MRKSLVLAAVLTFSLAGVFGTAFISSALAQDSAKVTAPSVPDTTVKIVPPPVTTDTAKAKTGAQATQPADTSKKVVPPKPAADTAKAKTETQGTPPADTSKKVTPPKPAADTGKAKTETQGTPPADTSKKTTSPKPKATTPQDTSKAAGKAKEGSKTVTEVVDPKAPYKSVAFAKGEKPKVVMETTMGKIVLELWPDVAMKHCQSFVYLINKGFYDSLTFHRIVPGFVIQGGDPLGNGTGGPGYSVPAEFSNKPHEDGVLSMARSPDPNSAGSQFFICLGRLQSLDNKYTVFGKVIEGLDVVHKIEKVKTVAERPDDPVKMTKVTIEKAEKTEKSD
jgi:peptidyl-prolyl cis-trans isomerase B (cyclophilin B)